MAYLILLLLIIALLAKVPIKAFLSGLSGLFSGSFKLAAMLFTVALPLWIATAVLIRLGVKII